MSFTTGPDMSNYAYTFSRTSTSNEYVINDYFQFCSWFKVNRKCFVRVLKETLPIDCCRLQYAPPF
ncbi:MAG: hypothetical protein IPF64_04160 [Flavobacteriales bacterium]|nr:hypothetical protein [Flavobacteriales bacterium]